MACQILVEADATGRLAELGLSVELIERVIRRADADAAMCTPLDPPIMEGLTRWGRANRYLREELVLAGWRFDNPRNLPRTIHPSGEFAIVAMTGDDLTGLAGFQPATKYPKGFATARAVEINGQLMLDFDDDFDSGRDDGETAHLNLRTWIMLFHGDEDGLRAEVALPDGIADGRITSWAERIILPLFPRDEDRLAAVLPSGSGDEEPVVVAVSRR